MRAPYESGISRWPRSCCRSHLVVLMLKAYLDDSGHKDDSQAPIFSVGGVVAPIEAWMHFEQEWMEVLQEFHVTQSHMKHFAHSRGEFAGWPEEKRRQFLGKLMSIMDAYVKFYVGAALPIHEFHALSPQKKRDLVDPYFACFQVSIHAVGIYAQNHYPEEQVDIVFDRRAKSDGLGRELFDRCIETLDVGGQLGTLSFGSTVDYVPLQVADLLAYELNLYRRGNGKMAQSRWPIQELNRQLRESQKEHFFDWFDGLTRPLNQFL